MGENLRKALASVLFEKSLSKNRVASWQLIEDTHTHTPEAWQVLAILHLLTVE